MHIRTSPNATPWSAPVRALVLALMLVAAGATTAAAQSDADKAEAFYLQAVEFFNAGRYQEALENFDQAIALQPEAVFYCNRATVLKKLGEHLEALSSMEACMERFEVYDDESAEEKAQITAEVQAMQVALRNVSPTSRGVATNIATRPSVGGGGGGGGGPDLVIVGPSGPGNTDEGTDGVTIAAWSAAGVAGAALTAALITDLVTQPLIEDFERTAQEGTNRDRYDALRAAIDQRKVIVGSLVVVGSVAAISSGVLFLMRDPVDENRNADNFQTDVVILQGGAAVQMSLDF